MRDAAPPEGAAMTPEAEAAGHVEVRVAASGSPYYRAVRLDGVVWSNKERMRAHIHTHTHTLIRTGIAYKHTLL